MVQPVNASNTYKQQIGAIANGAYHVDNYGAVGDGVTNDTEAILDVISLSGAGDTIIFTPGKTYIIDTQLNPNYEFGGTKTNQRWVGYGATLKRADEIKSTVTSSGGTISDTETTATLTSVTGFRVGQKITAYQTGTLTTNADVNNPTITAINGNEITFSPAWSSLPAGAIATATIIVSSAMIFTALEGHVVEGFTIDGNRDNNATYANWFCWAAVFITGDNNICRYCKIENEVGEGIVVGGTNTIVDSNFITNCGGNGIHATGPASSNVSITRNKVRWTQLYADQDVIGHSSGGIVFSQNCLDTFINGNYVEGSIAAFGSFDTSNNNSAIIEGNIARNCTDLLDMAINPASAPTSVTLGAGDLTSDGFVATISKTDIVTDIGWTLEKAPNRKIKIVGAIQPEYNGYFQIVETPDVDTITFRFAHDGDGSATSPATGTIVVIGLVEANPEELVFANNSCYNCGRLNIANNGAFDADWGPQNVVISGNYFYNCNAVIRHAHNIHLNGNTWVHDDEVSVAFGSRVLSCVHVNSSTQVTVNDHIEGGLYGVHVTAANSKDVKISGTFMNQYKYGVYVDGSISGDANIGVIGAQITADATHVHPFTGDDYTDENRWAPIYTTGGIYIKDCVIDARYGTASAFLGGGIYLSAAGNDAITTLVTGCRVRSDNKAFFTLASGFENALFKGNFVESTTQDPVIYPVAGGTGYVVGETMDVVGGTFTTAMQITVMAITGNVITRAKITNPGVYTAYPTGTCTTINASAAGNNDATFTFPIMEDNFTIV